MVKEVTLQVYSVKELAEEVRQRVLDKHRDINTEHEWWAWLHEGFKDELKELGVEVDTFYWSIDGDRHFFMSKPHIFDLRLFLTKLGLDKHELLMKFDNCSIYHISLTGERGRESNCAELDMEYSEEVECSEEKMEEMNELQNEVEEQVNNWIEDISNNFLREIEKQYEYACSNEAIIDTLEANEYQFDKYGNEIR